MFSKLVGLGRYQRCLEALHSTPEGRENTKIQLIDHNHLFVYHSLTPAAGNIATRYKSHNIIEFIVTDTYVLRVSDYQKVVSICSTHLSACQCIYRIQPYISYGQLWHPERRLLP
jgi:hypothetical protein